MKITYKVLSLYIVLLFSTVYGYDMNMIKRLEEQFNIYECFYVGGAGMLGYGLYVVRSDSRNILYSTTSGAINRDSGLPSDIVQIIEISDINSKKYHLDMSMR